MIFLQNQVNGINQRLSVMEKEITNLLVERHPSASQPANLQMYETYLEMKKMISSMPDLFARIMDEKLQNENMDDWSKRVEEETNVEKPLDHMNSKRSQTEQTAVDYSTVSAFVASARKAMQTYQNIKEMMMTSSISNLDATCAYLFHDFIASQKYIIDYGYLFLTRSQIKCLLPQEWISGCNLVLKNYEDKMINENIFSKGRTFIGNVKSCQTKSIPINDEENKHWFLITVYIQEGIILIADTLRSNKTDDHRIKPTCKVVDCLERITSNWVDGFFNIKDWSKKFKKYFIKETPMQLNGYDCGLYVGIQMICPQLITHLLSEDESAEARKVLAARLYHSASNVVEPGNAVTFFMGRNGASTSLVPEIDTSGLTLQDLIDMTVSMYELERDIDMGEVPMLQGVDPIDRDELVPLNNDSDLKHFIARYTRLNRYILDCKFRFKEHNQGAEYHISSEPQEPKLNADQT